MQLSNQMTAQNRVGQKTFPGQERDDPPVGAGNLNHPMGQGIRLLNGRKKISVRLVQTYHVHRGGKPGESLSTVD